MKRFSVHAQFGRSWRFAAAVAVGRSTPAAWAPPMPINLQVCRRPGQTAIARTWQVADARRCRLCAACSASADDRDGSTATCLIVTSREVRDADAWLYRSTAKPQVSDRLD